MARFSLFIKYPSWTCSQGAGWLRGGGLYFGAMIQFAGEIKKIEKHSRRNLHVRATGTTSEALLKAQTAQARQWFKCRVGPVGCSRLTTGDFV